MFATVDKYGRFTGVVYSAMTQDIQEWHDAAGFTWVVVDGELERPGEDGAYGKPTTEQLAATVRYHRDAKLAAVRWRIERFSDEVALGKEPSEALEPLLQYTQALRDVPQQPGFPEYVEWPEDITIKET